jgi:hypothetical protein
MLVADTSWIPIGIGYGLLGIQLVSSTTGIGYLNQTLTVPTGIHLVSETINDTRKFFGRKLESRCGIAGLFCMPMAATMGIVILGLLSDSVLK